MAENTVARTGAPARGEQGETPATRDTERYLTPAVDIYETEENVVLVADVPGVERDGLDARVEDGILTIRGTVSHEPMRDGSWTEFQLADYYRQFRVNEEVDVERITAELQNGVFTLTLPKREKARPKRIEVKTS